MFLELGLKKIKLLAEKNEEKNWRFRSFLKFKGDRKIDRIVHRLYHEISQDIDCTQCGNCCRELKPLLTRSELRLLSDFINVPPKKFLEDYTEFDDTEKKLRLKGTPCSFLKDNKCTVYECRPSDCRSFPHLHKREFTTRLINVLQSYSICPIVFNVYEQLKIEMRFC
jgi:Fe-S-cluster containining protein